MKESPAYHRLHLCAAPQVCVLFALPEEEKPFRKQAMTAKLSPAIFHSGVGVWKAADAAARRLTAHEKSDTLLIVCGFGGGLSANLNPGDLVLASQILDESGEFEPVRNFETDSALLATAESVRLSDVQVQRGTLVTGDHVLVTAQEKRELAARTGAMAVDMETAGAVRVAQARGVPWLAIRAITDGVNDDLPLDFNALANPDGSVNRGRVVRATLVQPWKIPALLRLGKRSSLAANNLAVFLVAFLQNLPDT